MIPKPFAVSLFTGSGGLDLGIEKAGFDIRVCVEKEFDRVSTLKINQPKYLPDATILHNDISKLSGNDILKAGKIKKGEIALLLGGPPCQPFSKSAYWVKDRLSNMLNDPRSLMLKEYVRIISEIMPESFILENVFGLKYKTAKPALDALVASLRELGYIVSEPTVLNAADFGVPQKRQRTFVIGSKSKKLIIPDPTHGSNDSEGVKTGQLKPYVSVGKSIGDLDDNCINETEKVKGKWGHLLPKIPPGKNYLHLTERGEGEAIFQWRTRFWSFLLKLNPEDLSWTIQSSPGPYVGPFHWNNRRLRISEIKRIQTFPDDYKFYGSIKSQWSQIGDAVPVELGCAIGKSINQQLFGSEAPKDFWAH